ncbi:hypothetical protein FQZ97_591150 [compost metagenome]
MLSGDLRHQRQADAAAAAGGARGTVKAIEDALAFRGRDARAVVRHAHERAAVRCRPAGDGDLPALRRIADRVVQQVAQQHAYRVEPPRNDAGLHIELDALPLAGGVHFPVPHQQDEQRVQLDCHGRIRACAHGVHAGLVQ